MTRTGMAAGACGVLLLVLGIVARWVGLDLVGVGLLVAVLVAFGVVLRPSRIAIERSIVPARVPKGSPALAVLTVRNGGRRMGTTVAQQPFGDTLVRTPLPRLRRGERGLRSYRLPTTRRGIIDVGPVEVVRRDPFELVRTARRYGSTERIWVYPKVIGLRTLPTGRAVNLEGPSSETSPRGTVTFHRLRDYVPGDDLRLVHWRSSARAGHLVVKHNVDTSLPYGVVLLDVRAEAYPGGHDGFEEAVDTAASVLVAGSRGGAPVELRLSDGDKLGGARLRDVAPLIDHLTALTAGAAGSLQQSLIGLRRAQGTSLVVITGQLDAAVLPAVAALRRRFARVVVVGIGSRAVPPVVGVRVITAPDAESVAAAWNGRAVQ